MLRYKIVDFNCEEDILLFNQFYHNIYVSEFPDTNERESLEQICKQAKRMYLLTDCIYYCILAYKNETLVGGIIGDYFYKYNVGVIEFIATSKENRREGVGTALVDYFVEEIKVVMKLQKNKESIIYFELENPYKCNQDSNVIWGRIGFWKTRHSGILQFSYIQPPLEKNKRSVDYLMMGIFMIGKQKINKSLPQKDIFNFLSVYFKYAFNITDETLLERYLNMQNLEGDNVEVREI